MITFVDCYSNSFHLTAFYIKCISYYQHFPLISFGLWVDDSLDICETTQTLSSCCSSTLLFSPFLPWSPWQRSVYGCLDMEHDAGFSAGVQECNLKSLPACCRLWGRQSCSCDTDNKAYAHTARCTGLCSYTYTPAHVFVCLFNALTHTSCSPIVSEHKPLSHRVNCKQLAGVGERRGGRKQRSNYQKMSNIGIK